MRVLFSTLYGFRSRMASTATSTFFTIDHVSTFPRSSSTIMSKIGAPARCDWTWVFHAIIAQVCGRNGDLSSRDQGKQVDERCRQANAGKPDYDNGRWKQYILCL